MQRLRRLPRVLILLLGVLAGVGSPGCSSKREPEENPAAAHLRRIAGAYDVLIYEKRRPPQSVEDLKPYLREGEQGDPNAFLISPNDGEPYEIVWGINLERVTDGSLLLAYEKKGVEGKRYAINAARVVKHLTDAEIEKASPPRGKKAKGG